jgi:acetate kinase
MCSFSIPEAPRLNSRSSLAGHLAKTSSAAELVRGVVEPIGGQSKLVLFDGETAVPQQEIRIRDHGQAAELILNLMDSGKFGAHGIGRTGDVQLVGYRVVHGGERYRDPAPIDDDVIKTIEEQETLAPLHNAGASAVIRASRSLLGEGVPAVAVFDTGFHRTLPDRACLYAIPWELTRRYGIRRYGFHGISHNYLMLRYAELTRTPVERTNIISLHLEGGSSATAVVAGKSIDTSMGFTPLEGLVMGTRSGDVDPALVNNVEVLRSFEHLAPTSAHGEQVDRHNVCPDGALGGREKPGVP